MPPPALQQPGLQPTPAYQQPMFAQAQQQQQPIQPVVQQPIQPQPQSILPGFGGLSGVGVGVGPLGGFQASVGSASIQASVGPAPGLVGVSAPGLGASPGLGGVGLGGFGFGAPGSVGAGSAPGPPSRGFKGGRGFSLIGDDDADDEGIDLNNLSLSLGGLGLGLGGDGEVDIDALATGSGVSGSTPWGS